MAVNTRPSLDTLVPLVMIENNLENQNNDNVSCESPKGLNRKYFIV